MGLRGTPIPVDDFPFCRRKDLTLTPGKDIYSQPFPYSTAKSTISRFQYQFLAGFLSTADGINLIRANRSQQDVVGAFTPEA